MPFLLTSWKVRLLDTHLLVDGLRSPPRSAVLHRRDKAATRTWSSVVCWAVFGPGCEQPGRQQQPQGLPGAAAEQNRPESLIAAGPYLRRACSAHCSLSAAAVFAWGTSVRSTPETHCKGERSQSSMEKQLLPCYTWPCTQRVHHRVVGTLTLRVAQKSCRI